MRTILLGALATLAGCASVSADATATPDAALAAIQEARLRECPPERTRANARTSGDAETIGVASTDLALVPLAHDQTRATRLRRLVMAPGAVIQWHEHTTVQGMAMIVSGEVTEFRNTCLDALVYRAGDIAREDIGTAHGWRNESGGEAVILVWHVVPR